MAGLSCPELGLPSVSSFFSVCLFEFVRARVCVCSSKKLRERNNEACLRIMWPFPCRITLVPSDGEEGHQQRCICKTLLIILLPLLDYRYQREKGKDIISSLILSLALSMYFLSDSGLNEAARFYHTDYFTGWLQAIKFLSVSELKYDVYSPVWLLVLELRSLHDRLGRHYRTD